MTPAEQFRAVNAAMRPLPKTPLWTDWRTGAMIFAALPVALFFILTVEAFL